MIPTTTIFDSIPNEDDDENLSKLNPTFNFEDIIDDKENQLAILNDLSNEFPVDVFPEKFKSLIINSNLSLNFPVDFIGTCILNAISVAMGKSAILKVKSGWFEYASLYTAIVGKAGANKSHPIELALNPFINLDKMALDQYAKSLKVYNEKSKSTKTGKKSENEKPVLKKTVLHNFTPEVLHLRLSENERGCIVVSEELATFLETMNNYSKGDQTSIYLSFWSNKGTSIDRMSKDIPLWLPTPFLNIIGGLQPRVLGKLFPKGKTNNGFLQRFLFAFPQNADKLPINDNELPNHVLDNYSNWINNYVRTNPVNFDAITNKIKSKIYYWSNDAKIFFYSWQKENTDKVNLESDSLKGEVLSKFDIHFVRLSLILQVMDDYTVDQISLEAVKGAAKLCSYYQGSAMKVLHILESGNSTQILTENKTILYNLLPDKFTTSEANLIGQSLNFNHKAIHRFISDPSLFSKISHGNYSKKNS